MSKESLTLKGRKWERIVLENESTRSGWVDVEYKTLKDENGEAHFKEIKKGE